MVCLSSPHAKMQIIKHSINITQAAIQHLNPGQTPLIACDQPLYALAKKIQCTWPASHGEDHIVIMLNGLHIGWRMAGDTEVAWRLVRRQRLDECLGTS